MHFHTIKPSYYFYLSILLSVIFFIPACSFTPNVPNKIDHVNDLELKDLLIQLRDNPADPLAYVRAGDEFKNLGNYSEARSHYEHALKIDSTFIQARLALGDLYVKMDQHEQASTLYQALLRGNPSDSLVHRIGQYLGQPYEIKQLTFGRAQHAFPDPSPDGKMLVCQSDENDNWDIYLLNVDGTNRRRITFDPGRDESPTWAPDGETIVFTSTRNDTLHIHTEAMRREIYLLNIPNDSLVRLTNHEADDWAPVFSPAGNMLLFESNRSSYLADSSGSDLFLLDRQKDIITRLTYENGIDGNASFINPRKILFASNRDGKFDIFSMQIDGSHPIRLFSFTGQNAGARMHRKGDRLAFFSKIGANFDVFLYHLKSEKFERLTFDKEIDACPKFSPDGKKIYFHSRRSGKYQIYAILLEKPVGADALLAQLNHWTDEKKKTL